MIEFLLQHILSVIIGCLVGVTLARCSCLRRDINTIKSNYNMLRLELPSRCVAEFEHRFLENRVRDLEEETRTLRLLVKCDKINKD